MKSDLARIFPYVCSPTNFITKPLVDQFVKEKYKFHKRKYKRTAPKISAGIEKIMDF
jgi:hypothetical protein